MQILQPVRALPPFGEPTSFLPFQPLSPEGPRYVARNRLQQAIRLALHERMAIKPLTSAQPTKAMWQRMTSPQRQLTVPLLPFSREDLSWGEWAGDGLLAIDKLAQECIQSSNRTIFFRLRSKGWELTKMGHDLMQVLGPLSLFATSERRDLTFRPRTEMMLDAYLRTGLSELNADNVQGWFHPGIYQFASIASVANDLGEAVRAQGRSASAGRAMQRHEDLHATTWHETKGHLTKAVKRHPSCCIKRFELQLPDMGSAERAMSLDRLHKASGVFVRSAKLIYGDAIVADARLIDRAAGTGYLAHLVLIFDGPTEKELAQVDPTLADLWREQTRGGDLIALAGMPTFQYRATGGLHLGYETAAGAAEKAAIYLARTREIIEVRASGGPSSLIIGETS